MIFNNRAVSLVIFGLLILLSDSTIGGSSNALVSAASTDQHTKQQNRARRARQAKSTIAADDFGIDQMAADNRVDGGEDATSKKSSKADAPVATPATPATSWGDSLPATAEDLKAKAEFVRLGATFVEGDSLPATAEDLKAKAEFVRLGATFVEADNSPVVPPIDEITAAAVSLPNDFCYNENGAEVCIYYYDDLTCRVKLDGRSFRTILSASFCASIAAPTSSDPSTGSQPIEHLSLRPSASPIVPPTDEIIVDAVLTATEEAEKAEATLMAAEEVQKEAEAVLKAAEKAQKEAQKSAEAATKATEQAQMEAQKATEKAKAAEVAQMEAEEAQKAAEMAAEEAEKTAEKAQMEAEKAKKVTEQAQMKAEKALKATEEAKVEAEKASEKAKAAEKAQKEAEKAQQEAEKAGEKTQQEAKHAAVNEGKEDTGVMLEEEEMVFLSLMYNRGDVETDSEIASLAVRQRRGRRRAHTIRRRATATKNRRETMAK